MLGNFVYVREKDAFPYALFIAGLFLSGWGMRLAFRRVTDPATLTFDPSCLTLSYAGSSSTWHWREIDTASVVRQRRYPHVALTFKPIQPSGIVPLNVYLNYPFEMSAESIRDEIIKRSRERPTSDAN
jgi:hypothetical protein